MEELRIKATVQDILNKGTKTFAKNIGADKVINALQDAEEKLKKASRNAYIFFEHSAKKDVVWSKLTAYKYNEEELAYAFDVGWFYESNGDTNKNKVIIE